MDMAGEMAQAIRSTLYKPKALSSIPSIYTKKAAMSNLIAGEAETGGCL